jgi:hypothetical protein
MRLSCRYHMPHLGSLSSLFLYRLVAIIGPNLTLTIDKSDRIFNMPER